MRNKKVLFITQGAVIAAIYVVLTYIVSLLGLTNGVIQVRLSEALTILPVFTPAAIPGLCHLQHTDRCCNMGCYLRKPCHTHRSGWHISSEKASQDTVPPSAHNCQYCYSTACTDLCLRRAGRIMVLGADGMCR